MTAKQPINALTEQLFNELDALIERAVSENGLDLDDKALLASQVLATYIAKWALNIKNDATPFDNMRGILDDLHGYGDIVLNRLVPDEGAA